MKMKIDFRPNLHARSGKLFAGRKAHGEAVHAGAFLRKGLVTLDSSLLEDAPELIRILTHEMFHFVWRRLGNSARLEWEHLLAAERTVFDLGWSAESRRRAMTRADVKLRTKRWREYCCEAFCDTAAWVFSPRLPHDEVSLPAAARQQRRRWFVRLLKERKLPL